MTRERIQKEMQIVNDYKLVHQNKEEFKDSWGATISHDQASKDEEIVLSVPAGDKIDLIEMYNVHAHPVKKGYNYRETRFITFRKRNGGIMDNIFSIETKFII